MEAKLCKKRPADPVEFARLQEAAAARLPQISEDIAYYAEGMYLQAMRRRRYGGDLHPEGAAYSAVLAAAGEAEYKAAAAYYQARAAAFTAAEEFGLARACASQAHWCKQALQPDWFLT